MIISYSEVASWDTCKRQWWYRFGLGYSPAEESSAISTGIKGHKLLQYFYTALRQGCSKEEALALMNKNAKQLLNHDEWTADGSLLTALLMVQQYIATRDFTSKVVLVENRFLLPLYKIAPLLVDEYDLHDVSIGFTPDVVFERAGNFVDIDDFKFVGKAWGQKKLNRFPQGKLYHIFLSEMGYNVSRSIVCFFNTTTNKISEYPDTLDNQEKATLIRDFVEAVREIAEFKKRSLSTQANARRTMSYSTCQFCAFERPCTLEALGKDTTHTFKAQFIKSNYDYSN